MDIGTTSVRYARALLKGATMAQQEDKVYEEMQKLFISVFNLAVVVLITTY